MATIQDTLKNGRGIKILDTQLDSTDGLAGKYDLLYHSNGRIYIAFARNDLSYSASKQTATRHIWVAYSTDGGTTFNEPVQITTSLSAWYDNPALCQIDPNDSDSPIGLALTYASSWTAANYPNRTLIDTELNRLSPIDVVTNATYAFSSLTLLRGSNRFILIGLNETEDSLSIYENNIVDGNDADGYLNNAWIFRKVYNFAGTGKSIRSIRVRLLSNGHLALIASVAKAMTGEVPLCDLGVCFSSDDGYTWTAFQYLTNYTGTPAVDLVGIDQCLSADLAELDNNQLAIVYQESIPRQTLGYYSSPQFNKSTARNAEYHTSKNLLFLPIYYYSDGIWVYDPATQTFPFRFTQSSTPPVWNTSINCISLSTDGKYLAAATASSLDVWDISATNYADWTIVTSLRTSNGLLEGNISWCQFTDEKTLVFSYSESSGVDYVWGGIVDVTDLGAGITNLQGPASSIRYVFSANNTPSIDVTNNEIYVTEGGYFWVSSLIDGTCLRFYSPLTTNDIPVVTHDTINDEWILCSYNRLYRLKDNGTTITLLSTMTPTSNPMLSTEIHGGFGIPDTGIFLYSLVSLKPSSILWYDFHNQKLMGSILGTSEYEALGFGLPPNPKQSRLLKNNEWLITATADNTPTYFFQYIKSTGRLKWGVFDYNPVTKAIDTDSDDLYPLCNTAWIPEDDTEHLVNPRICAAPMGNVCIAAFRYFPTRGDSRPLALVTGVMNLEHKSLSMRAAISKRTQNPPTLQTRGRVTKYNLWELTVKAQINFAQCLRIRAWIIPEQLQTVQLRASISNRKSVRWPGTFNVVFVGRQRKLRLQFTVNTGYTGLWECSSKARIIKTARKRFTGHFIVGARPINSGTFTCQSVTLSYQNIMSMKAFIVR